MFGLRQVRSYATDSAAESSAFLLKLLKSVKTAQQSQPKKKSEPRRNERKAGQQPSRKRDFEKRKESGSYKSNNRKIPGTDAKHKSRKARSTDKRAQLSKMRFNNAPTPQAKVLYSPESLNLGELSRFSPKLAYSPNSRILRATLQLFSKYNVPINSTPQPLFISNTLMKFTNNSSSQYPFTIRDPSNVSPTIKYTKSIKNVKFDSAVVTELFNSSVKGDFDFLRAEEAKFKDANLKLNSHVVANGLNNNYGMNIEGNKLNVVGSLQGVAPVSSLMQK
ncbi:BA75_04534T0 [Komagataella pastoris]|uniref:BA75_04534T0 n=1 Tax=Komagataella pastoris TaxID=4922 RepID=A0A1B2JID8_PICPA|nr:BA75_04534T0 [Komagataella pastoris]